MQKSRRIVVVALLVALLAVANTGQAQEEYRLVNIIELIELSAGFQTLAWSLDGTAIACIFGGRQIWYMDLNDLDPANLVPVQLVGGEVIAESEVLTKGDSSIAWAPNGSAVFFASTRGGGETYSQKCTLAKVSVLNPGEVTYDVVKPSDLPPQFGVQDDARYGIRDPFVVSFEGSYKLFFTVLDWGDGPVYSKGIFCLDLNTVGNINVDSAIRLTTAPQLLVNPVLLPTGEVLMQQPWTATSTRLWNCTGILDIIASNGLNPIENFNTDSRVRRVDSQTDRYAKNLAGSSDGKLLFFVRAVEGYDESVQGMDPGYEMVAITRADVLSGTPGHVLVSVEQPVGMPPVALGKCWFSPGGVRAAWFTGMATGSVKLYLGTLEVSSQLEVIALKAAVGWEIASDLDLSDYSGGGISFRAGDILTGVVPDAGNIPISISADISPLNSVFQRGRGRVPIRRLVEPREMRIQGVGPTITVPYTEDEVESLNEGSLRLFVDATAKSVAVINGAVVDTVADTVMADVDTLGAFVVATGLVEGSDDLDGDGLTDTQETMDLDPWTPGVQNPFDPNQPDSTGDNGSTEPDGIPDGQNDWDGDGMTNAQEFAWGYDPLDPFSVEQVPLSPIVGIVLAFVLALLTIRLIHCRNQSVG